ncbi:MAG: glycoside hydrolase family 125 protein [Clostridia bacterium]|nr:glycoside hydrolase family 125 protein [Clostridia bacterium]
MNTNPSVEKLNAAFAGDLTDYRSIPFWSWNNTLDEGELVRQIEDMKEAGMGGFIMHARIGLKDEYLGEKWFSCIDACLKKARELGMNAWVYDENGWPSGFVGGKLLEKKEFLAQYLTYEIKSAFDPEAFACYEKAGNTYVRLHGAKDGVGEYHCVYRHYSPANTDILNPDVVSAFIEETHEKYYRRFPESFGRELVGFFTDEPQYYRWATPFSPYAAKAYEEEFGGDILDSLIHLFHRKACGNTFRVRYYTVMNRLYVENFYKRLYDWCEAHNCKLTGHSLEEAGVRAQMAGGAGVMPTYEYEHIPGIDCLGKGCDRTLMPIQVGSVANQLGIHQVLTETFACCGHDTTPMELKNIGEFQYFHGVNLMCQHLFPYSLAAQGKSDYPPVFSRRNNWWEQFKIFNEYFTRLGYIIANTEEVVDLLLIHPLRSMYADYTYGQGWEDMEKKFNELICHTFRNNGIRFHLADERILARHGSTDGKGLTVGKCHYTTVVVPNMHNISASTLKLLEQYTGKLLILGNLTLVDGVETDVKLTSNITMDDLIADAEIDFRCEAGMLDLTSRRGELGDYIFINNLSQTESGRFTAKNIAANYRALDLETMKLRFINDTMTVGARESLILVRDDCEKKPAIIYYEEPIAPRFHVESISENYLVRDYGCISYDGVTFGEYLPLQRIFEDLLRADYKGRLWVKQTFTVKDKMPLTLMMEKGDYPSVTLNGKALSLVHSTFDIQYVEADITDAVTVGENVFVYEVNYRQHDGVSFALFDPNATESLRNCLYYDTHIENIFIQGDFVLNDAHEICTRTTLPNVFQPLCEQGYPFFKGTLTIKGFYSYDGHGARAIDLRGHFLTAEVTVNGKRTDLVLDSKKDITELLVIGKNEVEIVLRSSLRNLYGPFHRETDQDWVNPVSFTFRGKWNGGMAAGYTHEYRCVPFGLDDMVMLCEDHLIRVPNKYNLVYAETQPKAMCDRVAAYKEKLKDHPKLAQLYENGYLYSIRTVMDKCEDGTFYGFGGDIHGMWLRDSSTQVTHYVPLAKDEEVASIIEGVLRRQMMYIKIDPYANSFNRAANGNGHIDDMPLQNEWVFERKYEIDSLCYPMRLLYLYWKKSGREALIKEKLEETARIIVDLWRVEQYHMEKSPYRFIRQHPPVPWDTIPNNGMGNPVAYTGMTWCAFRPSDDGCTYGYLTASEMFAVVVLGYMAEMLETVCGNKALAKECLDLRAEIDEGIKKYCIIEHETYGKIYACETDGMGHYSMIDDANVPSLISIPYIGYAPADDEIYQNTRRFLLSKENPFYFVGKYAKGIGSRHTPDNYVWPLSLVMQGLTSIDPEEKLELLHMIAGTDAGTGYLHEGVDVDHPENYTRDWFPWPNSLYAEFIEKCVEEGII